MSETPDGGRVYTADDYTKVADSVTGDELPDPMPKAWVGTDLAPDVKAKRGKVTDEDFEDSDPAAPDTAGPSVAGATAPESTTTKTTQAASKSAAK